MEKQEKQAGTCHLVSVSSLTGLVTSRLSGVLAIFDCLAVGWDPINPNLAFPLYSAGESHKTCNMLIFHINVLMCFPTLNTINSGTDFTLHYDNCDCWRALIIKAGKSPRD